MASILGFLANIFNVFRRRQHSTPSDQQLDDVGAIMDEDYYKRDIVIAGKKITTSPYLQERFQAVRDVGHLAWLGGPAAAKFASNHLMEFAAMLQDENVPIEFKKQILFATIEICVNTQENQDKARMIGMLSLFYDFLDSSEADLRRGATACLVVLVNQNFSNHAAVLKMPKVKEKLLNVLQDDWLKWKRNEAARLILMLGLNRVEDETLQ